jgi:hypothetical protein
MEQNIYAPLAHVDEFESRAALRDPVTNCCLGFENHNCEQLSSIRFPGLK